MSSDVRHIAEAIGALLFTEKNETVLKKNFESYIQTARNINLLSEVINFPIQRYYGRTLVHITAFTGLPDFLEQLLRNGGDPDKQSYPTDLSQTPLHLAARQGYSRCISVLLNHGAQLRIENGRRETPVEIARGKPRCEVVFRNAIAKVEIPTRTQDQLQRVKDLHGLLDDGGGFDTFTSLFLELAEYERDLGSRWTDWFQQTLLYRAVDKKREDAVEFLLCHSSSVPLSNLGNSSTPLLAACYHGDVGLVTRLLMHSPRLCFIPDEQTGLSPLHISCSRGDSGVVRTILQCLREFYETTDSPTNLNMQDGIGRTPLFNACYHGRVDIVKQLLQFKKSFPKKLDANIGEQGGRTPLHAAIAASRNSKEIVDMLLQLSELNLNIEARPSSRANKYLLKMLKKGQRMSVMVSNGARSSSVRSSTSSLSKINPCQTAECILSPPITVSPLESPFSDNRDIEVGILKSKRSGTDSPVNSRFQPTPRSQFTSTHSGSTVRSRPSTPTTPPLTPPSPVVGVYQSDTGRLKVTDSFPEEEVNTGNFSNMQITPLAEACIFHSKEIVEQLLIHGARDKKALASQICSLIRRPELLYMILSRECVIFGEDDDVIEEDTEKKYQLKWRSKHLQALKGSWLSENGIFLSYENVDDIENMPCKIIDFKTVDYTCIHKVSLGHNHLPNVPLELFQMPNVTSIDLSENNLISLPEPTNKLDKWSCNKLSSVNLSGNSLAMLPSCIWVLPCLTSLNASSNKLNSLMTGYDPSQEGTKLAESVLVEISLSHNELSDVPEFLFKFPRVTKINLAHNVLSSLPKELWEQQSLQELNVSHNKLRNLPLCEDDELGTLSSPVEDDLLLMKAQPIGNLEATLKSDKLSMYSSFRTNRGGNTASKAEKEFQIKHVPDVDTSNQGAAIEQSCDYSSLTILDISHNEFEVFPMGLPCLAPNLVNLFISNNRLQSIDVVFLPQSLRKLIAKKCMIERIGNTLMESQLKAIRRFCYHSEESAVCLHRAHTCLPYLQTLDLLDNLLKGMQLIQHPPLGRKTHNLSESENIYQPNITMLNLLYPSLEGLNLTRNQLRGQLNPNIGRQTQLKWLRVSGNTELVRIPLEIAHLKNSRSTFTELEMRDLPHLIEPPVEYRDQNMQVGQILTYMRSKLKHSVPYRTMKLFLIGKGERGKTTLIRRLKETGPGETERTIGIDIGHWECRGKTGMFKAKREPIKFLVWDFAGQDEYHPTHQLFYSRRALYLALFRLSDGTNGINELDQWLRNVQLRAPGCIVIIVGTHLDKVSESEKQRLEDEIKTRFKQKKEYPQIVGCISVSSVNRVLTNNIDNLRHFIYTVASKLRVVSKDGDRLEYKEDLKETDPHALLQQQIPYSFLKLQEEVDKIFKTVPTMNDVEFKQKFVTIFENDDEELNEAVHYLTLQGTLLHFEDPGLRKLYFLDPEWLAKLMAKVISPNSINSSKIVKGRIQAEDLFDEDGPLHFDDPEICQTYLQLLQKFELALKLNNDTVLIPALLPEERTDQFPLPSDSLEDVSVADDQDGDGIYQPPIRRFWLSNYIPEGFWPRLICRVYKDHQVNSTLSQYINTTKKDTLVDWTTWKNGMVFKCHGRILVYLSLVDTSCEGVDPTINEVKLLKGKYRIELNIFVPDMIRNMQEVKGMSLSHQDMMAAVESDSVSQWNPFIIRGHATKLMVAISNHIISLSTWFSSGMVSGDPNGYSPCWKCCGGVEKKEGMKPPKEPMGGFITRQGKPVFSLSIEKCIVPACQEKDLVCPVHDVLKSTHQTPDLIFWDLKKPNDINTPQKLIIHESDLLGRGGFGFVCKGELKSKSSSSEVELVAVKVYLSTIGDRLDTLSTSDLVAMSTKPDQLLQSFKEIRQEVSFLANLDHPNITRLRGVHTKPTLCLLLELAPKKSLRTILKEYKERKIMLEPLTMKQSAKQIAEGLAYLHAHQIVHLDVKSPNVLVWEFPSATYSQEERVMDAGNVWLKLADYGISQVAPTMLMRMGSSPIGTPGYMAPEMFESVGQEISANKLDVFAYGMVLYELISLQVPFGKQPVQRRNHDVTDGKRPAIGNQERHTPLCIQDLMRLCWSQDPSQRPLMSQCVQWSSSEEFDRLRTEITLGSCTSIACSCVSRVEPAYEAEWMVDETVKTETKGGSLFTKEELERFGLFDKLMSEQIENVIEKNVDNPLTNSIEEEEEEFTKSIDSGSRGDDDDKVSAGGFKRRDSIYVTSASLEVAKDLAKKLLRNKDRHQQPRHRDSSNSLSGARRAQSTVVETSYSQIWMCGRDKKKGLLAVFILPDNEKNIYRFFGYIGSDEIQVLCPIRNAIWMGTSRGCIRVIHAPTLSIKYSNKLYKDENVGPAAILKILHVKNKECVFVTVHQSEVWCFHDRLVGEPPNLIPKQRIKTDDREDGGPVYDLVEVPLDYNTVQVWGTMDNNVLIQLKTDSDSDGWTKSYHSINPPLRQLKVCSYIVCCHYTDDKGVEQYHIWVSYRSKSGLVCMDVRTEQQIGYINCAEALKDTTPQAPSRGSIVHSCHHVNTLMAEGRRLIVGTLDGLVAMFDTETRTLLAQYKWHEDKVRSLLVLPEQIRNSICAEVSINDKEGKNSSDTLSSYSSFIKREFPVSHNQQYIPNTMGTGPLIASIGNGRHRMSTKQDSSSNTAHARRINRARANSRGIGGGGVDQDITLLIWHS